MPLEGKSGKGDWMREAMFEEPLALEKGTYALMPAPPARDMLPITFSASSRHFVWIGDDDTLQLAEIDGTSRHLATLNERYAALSWSRDGRKLLVHDKIRKHQYGVKEEIPFRATLYPLGEGEPVRLDDETPYPYYQLLPDGSGVYSYRQADGGLNFNTPEGTTLWLFVKPFGLPEVREFEVSPRNRGLWSADSRHYAHFVHPNNDPLKGVDLRVYDRQTKSVETLIHVESDDDIGLSETLAWTEDDRLFFAFPYESEAEPSLVVTAVPLHEPTAKISVFPLALEAGDHVRRVRLSPDCAFVAFEVTRRTVYSTEHASGAVEKSQGVFVASIADGRVHCVAPRGTLVSWLPGSRELIVAAGYGVDKRYYRVDVQEAKEAQ